MMDPTRIVLAGAWVSLMLIYLLGDVLRIFAGDFTPGSMGGKPVPSSMWTIAAAIMLVPIAMILVTLMVPTDPLRWITIIASVGLALFNLAGLPYPGLYDNVLIVVGVVVNGILIWQAWVWSPSAAIV